MQLELALTCDSNQSVLLTLSLHQGFATLVLKDGRPVFLEAGRYHIR